MPHNAPTPPAGNAAARPAETPAGHLDESTLRRVIGYQLAQASVVTLDVFDEAVVRPIGLRTVEFTALNLVCNNGTVSPVQLAKALRVSPSYITVALDKLQARGLVTREASHTDRRGQRVQATAEGQALSATGLARLLECERQAYAALSTAEQMMLSELLHKLAASRRVPVRPPRTGR